MNSVSSNLTAPSTAPLAQTAPTKKSEAAQIAEAPASNNEINLSQAAQKALGSDQLRQNWQQALTDSSVFDSHYYGEHNPDLAKAGLTSDEQLRQHWLTHGYKEGRQASNTFSARDYVASYTDLQAAGINSSPAALQHWLTYGMKEGRQGVSDIGQRPEAYSHDGVFDSKFYASFNPDLAANGVTSPEALKEHWLQHGIQEGRQASRKFDSQWYLDHYPDLRAAGLDTTQEALRHYNDFGIKEGRKGSGLLADQTYSGDQKLDLYTPAQPRPGKIPVVIDLPGGAWRKPDKSDVTMQRQAQELSRQGLAVLVAEYHGSPETHYPQSVNDVSDLLRYVRDHAQENNWDLDNITLMGGSAGSHLALQHALNPEFDQISDLPKVKNVIGLAPATNLQVDLLKDNSPRNDDLTWMVPNFLGSNDPELKKRASPLTYAGIPSDKRFFLEYAKDDWLTTPQDQVEPFVKAMQAAGQDLTVKAHEKGGHGQWTVFGNPDFDPNQYSDLANWIWKGVGR